LILSRRMRCRRRSSGPSNCTRRTWYVIEEPPLPRDAIAETKAA
jgi:hypothetical protein